MSEKDKTVKLFDDFPPVSTDAWEAIIEKDLKGAPYDKKLIWRTYEGFNVNPYYRAEDLEKISHMGTLPGEFPFLRGNKKDNNQWHIRQNIDARDVEKANAKALDVLMKGVTSLGFEVEDDSMLSPVEFKKLLNDICLESIELNFISGHASSKIVDLLKEEIKEKKIPTESITGSVDFDPIGFLTLKGNVCKSLAHSFDKSKQLIDKTKDLPAFRAITIHGDYFKNSGSGIVQELAFSLAAGVEYLTQLTERELSVDEIAQKLKFNFAASNVYFMEIAKLRAARLLWSKIVESYGVKDKEKVKMYIHSVTARWNKTIYDPYVNMLRTTTEGMAAALGGTDSLTIEPFNTVFDIPSEFSERIARNQQNLLNEESYFSKIADPSAGSYYIEQLTASIAEHAWNLFLEIQEEGGYVEAFKKGIIQKAIKETAAKRNKNIATRRDNLLGVNQFPNFTESIDKEVDTSVFEPIDLSTENAIAETLKPYRGSQPFEFLRYKTDKYAKANGRPKVFMFTYGHLAMRKARAQFSCNFFACAGFEVKDNNGFKTVDEGIQAALDYKADIVVICSSDDEYAQIAPEINEKLKGKAIVVVAGAPKCMDELKEKGVENFIHIKSNLLETLQYYQKALNI